MKQATCRGCGAAIIWTRTAKGKNMPVDAEPSSAGRFALHEDEAGGSPRAEYVGAAYTSDKYEAHWGTCPERDQFTRRG